MVYYTSDRLFSHLDITSSKYRNGKFNFVSCSNLSRSLGILYHMLKHCPKRFWPDWGFYKGYQYEYFQAQNLMMMMMMMRGGWDTLHLTLIYGQTEKNEYSSNKT